MTAPAGCFSVAKTLLLLAPNRVNRRVGETRGQPHTSNLISIKSVLPPARLAPRKIWTWKASHRASSCTPTPSAQVDLPAVSAAASDRHHAPSSTQLSGLDGDRSLSISSFTPPQYRGQLLHSTGRPRTFPASHDGAVLKIDLVMRSH
jgi:hypothetical protein